MIYPHFKITTKEKRLTLVSPPTMSDSLRFQSVLAHEDEDILRLYSGATHSKKNIRALSRHIMQPDYFAIYKGRTFIGYVGAEVRKDISESTIELYIAPAFREQGFGFDAAGGAIQWLMNAYDLKAIHAVTIKDNIPCHMLLRKLGFVQKDELASFLIDADGKMHNPVCVKYTMNLEKD